MAGTETPRRHKGPRLKTRVLLTLMLCAAVHHQRALNNGLLANANAKACMAVESFLGLIPGMAVYQLSGRVNPS